ncbi:hypothetical protein P4597_27705 [Peribacillus simplex]|uniref:hypothetical protein n=1 Tax=Peribacillus simplex TaxID=1478 RepID=UPI002E1B6C0F|nr:hypothetical protein [Peribacillus simplex]
MFYQKECIDVLTRMFINNGEYEFSNQKEARKFIKKVLSISEEMYSSEGYYHKYEDFKDFLYTSKVDGIAWDVSQGEYD